MKRFLLLAAVVVGLTFCGFSTAKADGWRGGGWRGGYRPYGAHWGGPRFYGYGYRPYVGPRVFIGGPRIGIGVGYGAYGYPTPYPPVYGGYGYGYPGYGW